MDETLRAFVAAQVSDRLLQYRLQRSINVPNPAAGADWILTVPQGVWWELVSVRMILTTSAVVANRAGAVGIRDQDGNEIVKFSPGSNIAASTANNIYLISGYGAAVNLAGLYAPLPSPFFSVQSGWSIRSTTSGLDVGDQYTGVVVTVREWSGVQAAQHLEKVLSNVLSGTFADREI